MNNEYYRYAVVNDMFSVVEAYDTLNECREAVTRLQKEDLEVIGRKCRYTIHRLRKSDGKVLFTTSYSVLSSYEKRKEEVREEAIEYQSTFGDRNYSWGEVAEKEAYFRELGKRYGLLREFHENCIC